MEGEETMQTIGITTPWIGADEAVRIAEWLESGKIDYIHLRHPDADVRQVERLILRIPQHLRRRLTLHGHFSIAQKLDVGDTSQFPSSGAAGLDPRLSPTGQQVMPLVGRA